MSRTHWPYELHPNIARASLKPREVDGMPKRRRLRVFTQDPGVAKLDGAISTLSVLYEPLDPGPAGAWFVVDDRDDAAGASSRPALDLEHRWLLMSDGLDPSTTDRAFACQMTYAVAMETFERFRHALGRDPEFASVPHADGRLRLRPRAFQGANAYYARDTGTIEFGWDLAAKFASGRSQPGGHVFLALSRDIVAHEVSHALLDGLRPNFLRPTHPDVAALHEGFSDLVAIFLHFAQKDVVVKAIERTQGDVDTDALAAIGRQFGYELIDGRSPLRTALHSFGLGDEPVPPEYGYAGKHEEHALGAVLVSAVFEAFRRVFKRRTAQLRRVFASYQGTLPSEGVELLASRACDLARQFLDIVIRAIDYCPSHHCTFGEFLRAMITADVDLVPDDPWAYREALVIAFRRFGIVVPGVEDLSEQSLQWRMPAEPLKIDALKFSRLQLDCTDGLLRWPDSTAPRVDAADALAEAICDPRIGRSFGLMKPGGKIEPPNVMSLRTLRRVAPNGDVNFGLVAEVVQKRQVREGHFFGGCTLVLGGHGDVRYAIVKDIDSERRLLAQRAWLRGERAEIRTAAWSRSSSVSAQLLRGMHRERT